MRHCNLPHHLYVYIDNVYLGPDMPSGRTEAVWHAIHCRPGQELLCHVLLATGANWSGMPLRALSHGNEEPALYNSEDIPWGAMGERIEAVHMAYLEGLCIETVRGARNGRHTGIMVDWADGFSRYPQEHKPLQLVAMDSGRFALLPNNYLIYRDKHFVDTTIRGQTRFYKRGTTVYWE